MEALFGFLILGIQIMIAFAIADTHISSVLDRIGDQLKRIADEMQKNHK